MRRSLLILLAFLIVRLPLMADEGMWFLMHLQKLNQRDMQKMGLGLTAEDIYSVNNSSLKDAIVQFNGGCTAEMVSGKGLVMTNHHCGYGAIAELSDTKNNYLKDGFWAKTHQDELKPKALYVRFFVRMDDVSNRILSLVNDEMPEQEREKVITNEINKIVEENSENGKYVVSVRPFYNGNEYYYFVYQDYHDVRLVGTPPSSIGKFGGDTDNWEWPRHTGDFALFRVYADANGQPADYSVNNVPLVPRKHLTVSLAGFKNNDFSMILGYPGRTNRWMPAGGVEQNAEYAYPAWVEAAKVGMDALKKHMDQNPQVQIDYASKYSQIANYWKNRQGMIDALKQHNTVGVKRKQEAKFQKWAQKKANRDKYGDVLQTINDFYAGTQIRSRHDNYMQGLLRASTFASLPSSLGNGLAYYAQQNDAKRREVLPQIVKSLDDNYANLYLPLEIDVLAANLELYATKAKEAGIPQFVQQYVSNAQGSLSAQLQTDFAKSVFRDRASIEDYLKNPTAEQVTGDPIFQLSSAIMQHYRRQDEAYAAQLNDFNRAFRLYVDGFRKMNPKKKYYPDANSTLRLTYGKIRSLPKDPRNDASENYYTTLKGTIAKYVPGDEEFDLPQRLIDLYEAKDYGQYADKNGNLPVNFLSDQDITGGNSGSPVLNGKGELIGIAFDGNIEAMAGDVIFDPKLQRTISVDIRYVLFIIDKYAGATHIIDELTIAR